MASDASSTNFAYYFPDPTETKENLRVLEEFDASTTKAFEHFAPLLSDEYAYVPNRLLAFAMSLMWAL